MIEQQAALWLAFYSLLVGISIGVLFTCVVSIIGENGWMSTSSPKPGLFSRLADRLSSSRWLFGSSAEPSVVVDPRVAVVHRHGVVIGNAHCGCKQCKP